MKKEKELVVEIEYVDVPEWKVNDFAKLVMKHFFALKKEIEEEERIKEAKF